MSHPLYEIELPAAWFDALIEDAAPAVVGLTPTLINRDPEPLETKVPKSTNVAFDLATIGASGTVDLSATQAWIDGVLAFDAGTFQAGFNGASSAYSNPQADVLRVIIDKTVDFLSEAVVSVRVRSKAVGDPNFLDETYTFTIADTTAPRVSNVIATDVKRVRVTFSESVLETAAGNVDSALTPGNWALDRLGDYLVPVVSAKVVSVEVVDTFTVDFLTDIPLTPGGNYRVTATTIKDLNGNTIVAPFNTKDFLGWLPPTPPGRDFDMYKRLPSINRREDETQDLFRFIGCFQEVLTLLLWDVDRFTDILDPDLAPEEFVDAMLADLGNPFLFDLTLIEKRQLALVLVDMYLLKGTSVGIINVIRFFLDLEVTVDPYNGDGAATCILGESELGVDWTLGTDVSALLYSFEVKSGVALTQTQRDQIEAIVEYMKPAHTHFVRLVEPTIPVVLDHWELGLSELGENSFLHAPP